MLKYLALAMGIVVAASAQAEEPVNGGILKLARNADIRSLDGSRQDANTDTALNHLYDPLVAFRDDMSVGPVMAKSWTTSDDGKTWTFTLRDGATYHDGSPVKAGDFAWLWDRYTKLGERTGTPWLCGPVFDGSAGLKVNSVTAPDDKTLVFQIEQPNPLFLVRLADQICHIFAISPANVDEKGNWIEGSAIGSGPFKMKEWRKEQYLALERFDKYVPVDEPKSGYAGDRTAYVDEVHFVVVPDANAAETALFAGQLDVVSQLQPDRIADVESKGGTVLSSPGLSLTTALVQTQDPLLSNVKIRQALAHAIDLEQLTEVKTAGLTKANPSGVPLSSAYYGDAFKVWPAYDPEKAKALLAEAGYKGEKVTIQANRHYIGMYDNAMLLQAMFAGVGVNTEVQVLDWAAQLDNFFSGKFQVQSFGYSQRTDPVVIYGMLMGEKAKDPTAQWDDPKANELYNEISTTDDFETRKQLLGKLQAMMAEQVPILPLYYAPVVEIVSPKVKGYTTWPLGQPRAWGVWKSE